MIDPHATSADPRVGRLVSVDGSTLPLLGVRLSASAAGGLAEVVLEQRFRNPHQTPLSVIYTLALPPDAAVSGYSFTIGQKRVVGEVDRRAAARELFERALADGKTASLLEQDRSNLFSQEIGNVPPGAEVVATLTIDQRLRWLEEGAWEWRFPTTAGPRYQGEEAGASVDIADGPLPVRVDLTLGIREALAGSPESPSHPISWSRGEVTFQGQGEGGVPLDRDVVVRWPVAGAGVGLTVETARAADAAHGLLTIVPPAAGRRAPLSRDLIVLLDTSGSMAGEPLDQARRLVSALVDTLGDEDRLELIEFSTAPRRWQEQAVAATAAMKREALAWLGRLTAAGGTEMHTGILEALRPLRPESQRQVVLVTDGLIGFEDRVVGAILRGLPASSRVHTVGVGSAVNRALTGAAARAGRGVEVVIGLGEDPERGARRLVARTDAPLVVDLVLEGTALEEHAPRRLPDLFAGAPPLVSLALRPEGGSLTVRGRTASGPWQEAVHVPATLPGQGRLCLSKLFARERVEDLELRAAAGEPGLDAEIERIGLEHQISTRLTSWIAVSEERSVDPGQPTKRIRIPQELPYGMSVEAVGLRPPRAGQRLRATVASGPSAVTSTSFRARWMPPIATAGGARVSDGGSGSSRPLPPPPGSAAVIPPMGVSIISDTERRFRGRVTAQEGRRLTIELTVVGPDLDWRIGRLVQVVGREGTASTASVVESTPAGTVSTGSAIRLVIELPSDPVPLEVIVSGGPDLVVIVL